LLQLFVAIPTDNNAVNEYKKQDVLASFGYFSITISYIYANFRLLKHSIVNKTLLIGVKLSTVKIDVAKMGMNTKIVMF
jgi:hypothetical protein